MFATSGFPENGYRDLLDLESFAKYIMIQQFMDNFDFNNKTQAGGLPGSNFIHKDKGKKIIAGPIWDMDLSAGVEMNNFPKHYQSYNAAIKPKHPFYLKFFDDPVFLAKWKKNWDKYLNDFRYMTNVMDSIATYVQGSVEKNFALQNNNNCGRFCMAPDAPGTVQAYKDEVGKLKTWWNNRITFFGQEIEKMNIDTSKDIQEPSSLLPQIANNNQIIQIYNGIHLQTTSNATVEIYNVKGNLINKQNYADGIHSVSLAHLSKGIYIVKVQFGNEIKALRMVVR
jgi:hypothetical protein